MDNTKGILGKRISTQRVEKMKGDYLQKWREINLGNTKRGLPDKV